MFPAPASRGFFLWKGGHEAKEGATVLTEGGNGGRMGSNAREQKNFHQSEIELECDGNG